MPDLRPIQRELLKHTIHWLSLQFLPDAECLFGSCSHDHTQEQFDGGGPYKTMALEEKEPSSLVLAKSKT